ncbi:hypothetical protein ACIG87_24155 [Micromonospora sp. NPDC051925]|uniref:hypothetical protein n=1 Tax=Micromonospora sp. NPDC051925 TaxID=3364288 RepID=UPI0037C8F2E7
MSHDEETLVRQLLARAADDLPDGGVGPETLLVAGEQVMRRRRRVVTAAAAIVTVFALFGVAVAVVGVRQGTIPGDGNLPSPTVSRTGPPAVAPERFDPTRRLLRLGNLPAGAGHQSYQSDLYVISVRADVPEALSPGGPVEPGPMMASSASVVVRVGARGQDVFGQYRRKSDRRMPSPAPSVDLPGSPVAPVGGHPAHLWAGGGDTVLSWQYAPDGWISVGVIGFDQPEAVVRQVATGLLWEEQRVTVPFEPVADPPGSMLKGVEIRTYRGRWLDVTAHYVMKAGAGEAGGRDILIGVSDGVFAGDGSDFRRTRLMVRGRVASADDGPKGFGAYRVAQVPGCAGCVAEVDTESEAGHAAVGGRDGGLDLAASIRLVDGSDDPTGWRPL